MKLPDVGKKAPDFTALDDRGAEIKLSDYIGREVVLYFYPRADTPGCTKEACGFRDDYSAYEEAGVVILGVSPDTIEKQSKFKQKWDLPFPLIADDDHSIATAYGVWGPKKFMEREYEGVHRTTFLIDKDGKIKQVFENVKPAEHSQEILAAIRS
ncbi:MAG: thioredoxin-dependent thiol peroxidase [Anaerolineales bacterium]|nr:thioredoxin-dependent thiol peroxidase [Anaerolineales bacterium]